MRNDFPQITRGKGLRIPHSGCRIPDSVMVATDVASKGLDFPDIQHVINFDMPEDIENYGTDRVIF